VEDMCYERRRAEACVDESAHHALANAGGREIVVKKEGEQKGSARGSVHWGCYYATALDIEVDPQRCCLGSCQSDFALQAVVECRALEPIPVAMKCASVSRCACRKRRRRNSPCMRVEVLTIAGRKEMF
jgi:hypothetical protein